MSNNDNLPERTTPDTDQTMYDKDEKWMPRNACV